MPERNLGILIKTTGPLEISGGPVANLAAAFVKMQMLLAPRPRFHKRGYARAYPWFKTGIAGWRR
jgi:hypothetical protein